MILEKEMNWERLENSIVSVVKEQQLKIGYREESLRLYYMMPSLVNLLGIDKNKDITEEELRKLLIAFRDSVVDKYGKIMLSDSDGRFCFKIPQQGVVYIHESTKIDEFLSEFIGLMNQHHCTMEQVIAVFRKFSECVFVQKIEHNEFDFLLFFTDGIPNDYRYLFTVDGEHIHYHRFTIEDYEEMFGDEVL